MQKELLMEILAQNQVTCGFAFQKLSTENLSLRLNDNTASLGFIYRHIGETMNMFGAFFGEIMGVENTTMGQEDKGQGKVLEDSVKLVSQGYEMLQRLVENNTDSWWLEEIDTPFFGRVTRIRLFAHVLFHNAHHAGQLSLTLARGSRI
ncbi:MAG: DinB family protein [Saprospiraceae bacterium]